MPFPMRHPLARLQLNRDESRHDRDYNENTQPKVSYAKYAKKQQSGSQWQPPQFRRDEFGTAPKHLVQGRTLAPRKLATKDATHYSGPLAGRGKYFPMTGEFTPVEKLNFAYDFRSIHRSPVGWNERMLKMDSMSANSGKSAWLSGEVCSRPGNYFSDSCGHPVKKEFTTHDIFSRCTICHQSIRWIIFAYKAQKTLTFNPKKDPFAFLRGRSNENA